MKRRLDRAAIGGGGKREQEIHELARGDLALGVRHRNGASRGGANPLGLLRHAGIARGSAEHRDRRRCFRSINPDAKKTAAGRRAQLQGEYRFGDVLWIVAPFVGLMGTSAGAFYGYAGFGFDVNFGPNWVVTPTFAGGYWYRGDGLNLGSWWEFRSGAEFDYRFANRSRLGLAFYHMSNAGLTKQNPGEQALLLVYTVPLR